MCGGRVGQQKWQIVGEIGPTATKSLEDNHAVDSLSSLSSVHHHRILRRVVRGSAEENGPWSEDTRLISCGRACLLNDHLNHK